MFGATADVKFDPKRVKRAVDRGNTWSLGRAGAYLWGVSRKSIGKSPDASDPGTPPHTRRGKLKDAIVFAVNPKVSVVIGPAATRIGQVGRIHEFGGKYRVRKRASRRGPAVGNFPKRPFMAPALEIARPRIPLMWAGSVRE